MPSRTGVAGASPCTASATTCVASASGRTIPPATSSRPTAPHWSPLPPASACAPPGSNRRARPAPIDLQAHPAQGPARAGLDEGVVAVGGEAAHRVGPADRAGHLPPQRLLDLVGGAHIVAGDVGDDRDPRVAEGVLVQLRGEL